MDLLQALGHLVSIETLRLRVFNQQLELLQILLAREPCKSAGPWWVTFLVTSM